MTCTTCHVSVSKVCKENLKRWLEAPCVTAMMRQPGRYYLNSHMRLVLARREAHGVHAIFLHRAPEFAIWACGRCGLASADFLSGLAKACKARPSRAGRQNLRRLAKGLLPGNSAKAKAFNRTKVQFAVRARNRVKSVRGARLPRRQTHARGVAEAAM